MLQPLKMNRGRRKTAAPAVMPAPVGGLDTVSPLTAMPANCALQLDNFFCQPGWIEPRGGSKTHATGVGSGAVESLMAFNGGTAQKLFAASGNQIYDVTSAGPGVPQSVAGLTDSRLKHINFATAGSHYLWVCGGGRAPTAYNGTSWVDPSITGITPANIIDVTSHKARIWLAFRNSTKLAYLPVDSYQGAATEVDVGPFFKFGGNVWAITTWMIQTTSGRDEFLVIVSEHGEFLVYGGTNPGDATAWGLVGTHKLPRLSGGAASAASATTWPISRRRA